jgi:hypothetical protein
MLAGSTHRANRHDRSTVMKRVLVALCAFVFAGFCLAGSARAETAAGYKSYITTGEFEDVLFELNNAIIDRGLVVDYTGHLQTMLERTSEAVGSVTPGGSKTPYLEAKYLQFCSAKLTHGVVSANPLNIAICPYVVFIFELKTDPGKIHVGYRRPIAGPSRLTRRAIAKVEALLDGITKDAVK